MKQRYQNILGQITIVMLLIILAACNQQDRDKTVSQTNTGAAEEVLTLNNQNSSEDTPIITAVSLITTDEANNIYLVDYRTMKIHSYTSDLSHRWTAGGKGSGPGLFNIISAIYINDQQLYVYEHANATMTLYSLSGERLQEWSFGEAGHRINTISQMSNGSYVATGWNDKSETVVNIYSNDFKTRTSRFVKIKEIFDTENPELETQVARSYPGSILPAKDSTLIYAPAAYNGRLPVYRLNTGGNWARVDTVKGYTNIENPLVFHFSQDGENERSHLSGFKPGGGYFYSEFTSMSHGLYKLKNGQIAHLSTRLNKNDQWDLVIEYFKTDNIELQNYTIIEGLIPSQQFQQVPLWMDKNGKIYMTENSDKPLHVLKVSNRSNN